MLRVFCCHSFYSRATFLRTIQTNFHCSKLVSNVKQGKEIEGVWKRDIEENNERRSEAGENCPTRNLVIWSHVSPNIVWMIKSRRMRWARRTHTHGDVRYVCNSLVGKSEGKRLPELRNWIILKWIYGEFGVGMWTGLTWLRTRTHDGLLWTR
jgi:hypothetical protein